MKNKYHVSTTISMKHWAILKKYADKFDTHQRVLEIALEGLENNQKYGSSISREEAFWIHIGKDMGSACLLPKDTYREMVAIVDMEQLKKYLVNHRHLEYMLEDYNHKPLKECSMEEVIDGIVAIGKITKFLDMIYYVDNGDHYTLKLTHDLGMNNSIVADIVIDSVFKTYGVKTESKISEGSLFIKIFKKLNEQP